jgi:hypothetical protein
MNTDELVAGQADEVNCDHAEADSSAPISEAEFHEIFHMLERKLKKSSCDGTLRHTRRYLRKRYLNEAAVLPWLKEHVGYCDGRVLECAQAYFSSAPIAWPTVRMDALREACITSSEHPLVELHDGGPLSEDEFLGLCEALEEVDCDGTLRVTRSYLREHQIGEPTVIQWLEEHGGGCDCEVLLNVLLAPRPEVEALVMRARQHFGLSASSTAGQPVTA